MSAAQVLFNTTPINTIQAEPKRRGSWVPTRRKSECPLEVNIDRHFEAKIYTSGSTITGSVSFSPSADLTVDAFEIVFTGSETTLVQMFHQGTMPKSGHKFLQLRMPIPESALPPDGVLQAGQTYEVPFSFVIPYQLPSAACKHRNPIIRERHLQLPPTIGSWEHDDMAVHTIAVNYGVDARALLKTDKGKSMVLERTHPVKVMPYLPEQPPLHIVPGNPRFTLTHEKSIRKDILSSKLGYIRATTRQPDPVIISADKLQPSECSLNIDLEFWPTSKKATPPEMYAKSATIKASTYYSTGHLSFLPDQHNFPSVMPNPILSFVLDESATVTSSPTPHWEQTSASISAPSSRRGSENSTMGEEPPRTASRRGSKSSDIIKAEAPRHTATLPVSIALPSPDNKILLPTFYSCLISRTYILEVVLASRAHGSSFMLRLPLQIAVEGHHETGINHVPTYEQVQAGQDLYDALPTYDTVI
ncbi:hypothetical protein IWW34DRAFT_440169 [Fusarium oxysporum f. sp. albedinis]|nr:hypothetical protein FOMA001_g14186 [Fusarium oxysporum f. sp. matthiolae]KAI3579375.1 hypothetical protein IWW34DRAFT_440169 [Fusarium oxysporum f. sp. albedinis]KAK2474402.1 hypothetical protein H9L39_14362 [Fusarium oxysporum f. sp. albedinis]